MIAVVENILELHDDNLEGSIEYYQSKVELESVGVEEVENEFGDKVVKHD